MKKFLSCIVATALCLSSAGTSFAAALPRDIDVKLDAKVGAYSGSYSDSLVVTGKSTDAYTKVSIDMNDVKTAWNAYIEKGVEYLEGVKPDAAEAKQYILENVPLTGTFTLKVKGADGLALNAPQYSEIVWSEDASELFEAKNTPAITYNSSTNEYTLEMKIKSGVTNSDLDDYFNDTNGLGDIWLTTMCEARTTAYGTYSITADFDGAIEATTSVSELSRNMKIEFSGTDTTSIRFKSSGGTSTRPTATSTPKPTTAPTTEPTATPEPQTGGTANGAKLNYTDRFAYIEGYDEEDGTSVVRPEQPITRAEVATIFFRLLDEESRAKFLTTSNNFTDVAEDSWYNESISTAAAAGIINGYEDGSFRPDRKITRAEFAAIAARFTSLKYDGSGMFSDLDGHWAENDINNAAVTGWVNGYEDGTFKPDDEITRAEAIALINRMLYRDTAQDRDTDSKHWNDNTEDKWYYEDVQDATNSKETKNDIG